MTLAAIRAAVVDAAACARFEDSCGDRHGEQVVLRGKPGDRSQRFFFAASSAVFLNTRSAFIQKPSK
jgi:hypothetical protein